MDIRQRLHLSGMDSHAPELARKWGLGLEVTDFCYAPMLDDPATLPAVREKMAGIDHFWLHHPVAPFAARTHGFETFLFQYHAYFDGT